MSKPKALDDCRSDQDFFAYGKSKGGIVAHGGRHPKIYGPRGGSVSIVSHNGDIKIGTRRSIVKMMIAIGLGLLPIICYISR
jgi:hypothetical protein